MSKRELIPASEEHQRTFPLAFELKPGLEDNLEAVAAFRHATKYKLWPDELQYIGAITQRRQVWTAGGIGYVACSIANNAVRPCQDAVDQMMSYYCGRPGYKERFDHLQQVFGQWAELRQLDPNSETYIANWQTFLVSQPMSYWEG